MLEYLYENLYGTYMKTNTGELRLYEWYMNL